MTMHKALHCRDNVDRLYVSRKGESIQQFKDFIEKCRGRLITTTRNNTDDTGTRKPEITRKQTWEEKQLNGRFKRLTSDISHKKTWTWLRKGNLKRETESLPIAAQNNALETKLIKARIDKTQQNSRYRLCGDRDEMINHIISEYSK